jgi:hypothetical protein
MTTSELLPPLQAFNCPICGNANACAAAQTGGDQQPCWCATTTISAEVLGRIPDDKKRKACICQACAEGKLR